MSDQPYGLGPYVTEHYALLQEVLNAHTESPGIALEFGVGSGTSTGIIAKHMPVIGFDSFEGLPEDWREGFPKGSFKAEPPLHLIQTCAHNVHFQTGLFESTLPTFVKHSKGLRSVRLLHIDCDLYSSTKTVLEHVMPMIYKQPLHRWFGLCIVFDEWHGFEGCEDHEQRAWREFVAESPVPINWRVLGHSFQQWGIQIV